jgi:hypothetical protein
MSRLTLRLPETLHQQLIHLAEDEGVSLNQYIVYALTRQVTQAYTVYAVPDEKIRVQRQNFESLIQKLGQASHAKVGEILAEREAELQMEEGLTPELVNRLQQKINGADQA